MNNQVANSNNKKLLGNILTVLFVIGAFVAIYYTATFFKEKDESVRSENPLSFCQPANAPPEEQKCFFTTHIHLHLAIKIFGKVKPLPFEKGDLTQGHTHSQNDEIHWHALVEVDPITKNVPDSEFALGKVFDSFGIPFSPSGIFSYRNGSINPTTGKPAELKMFVNGEENTEFRDYIWRDGDKIEIVFE